MTEDPYISLACELDSIGQILRDEDTEKFFIPEELRAIAERVDRLLETDQAKLVRMSDYRKIRCQRCGYAEANGGDVPDQFQNLYLALCEQCTEDLWRMSARYEATDWKDAYD